MHLKLLAAAMLVHSLVLFIFDFSSSSEYVEYRPGTGGSKIIISAPHGGSVRPRIIPSRGYAIPKINMLCNLMLFQNEVKAAVR